MQTQTSITRTTAALATRPETVQITVTRHHNLSREEALVILSHLATYDGFTRVEVLAETPHRIIRSDELVDRYEDELIDEILGALDAHYSDWEFNWRVDTVGAHGCAPVRVTVKADGEEVEPPEFQLEAFDLLVPEDDIDTHLALYNSEPVRRAYARELLRFAAEYNGMGLRIVYNLNDGSIRTDSRLYRLRDGDVVLDEQEVALGMTPGGPDSEWPAFTEDGDFNEEEFEAFFHGIDDLMPDLEELLERHSS
ncbi:hypothetical protein QOL99_11880 [Deinococcus sp. MIMF12]|uniref:Uncharacterized protein n=1 Tax=Deinococcus rhizophilus TaxID=3049544 RepID=A0ABT7JIT0_9DEIO|nr:hypothetical protein [Deinococcus rhizophilus]MDL2344846.1 hypothetical protein [Deinococcus rhizophilus]